MPEYLSDITHIGPSYPVKPVRPSEKDREPASRRRKRQESEREPQSDEDDDPNHIDEHV